MSVSSSVLYYPTIDVENEQWLRNAILFWDTIQTIVPISIKDPYKSKFSKNLHAEGILQPLVVSPDMEDIEEISSIAEDYITDPSGVSVLFPNMPSFENSAQLASISEEVQRFVELIHYDKLPSMLRVCFDADSPRWIPVHKEFAKFYITLLASHLANQRGIGIVTESNVADQLAITIRKGRPIVTNDNAFYRPRRRRNLVPMELSKGMLVELVLENIVLPANISVKEILKFKKEHAEELALFRQEINKLVSTLPVDMPLEALRLQVSDIYISNVKPALKSLKDSLALRSWDTALQGFLKTSFFAVGPTSAAVYAGMPSSVALLAGTGVSLISSGVQVFHKRQELMNNNPYSYLLSLNKAF